MQILFCTTALHAQELGIKQPDYLEQFQQSEGATERYHYFFSNLNRYREHSAYDWLESVNVFLNNSKITDDTLAIQKYMLIQAQLYHDLRDYDKSVAIANELYTKRDSLDKQVSGKLLDILDKDYAQLQLYDRQIEIREEKRKLGLSEDVNFYDIYASLGLYRKAMNYYIMEVKKDIPEDDYYALAEYNNNVGNFLRLDKSASTAITNLKKAENYIELYLIDIEKQKTEEEVTNGNLLKGVILGNIGKCHVLLKEYETAIPLLEESLKILKEYHVGDYGDDVIENSLNLAECHLQQADYKIAKKYLDSASPLNKAEHILKRNRLLASYYDSVLDYKNAVSYLKKNVRINDSINANTTVLKKQQLVTVAEQEVALTRRLIDEQKLEMERDRSELEAKDERLNLVFISLVFTLLGFTGLVYAYLKSIKNQRLIAEQKYIIENSLIEKDSLLKEIHHRVKNNLQMVSSLLSLQTKNTKSKAAIVALEEGKSRVKAMALIHQKLYQNDDLSVIEMQGYIESLINSVQSVYKKGGHNIHIAVDAEGVELDIDRAIPFGLILNELVSNSFKYAFPNDDSHGKIYIHLRKTGEGGYFEYVDNGIGLPDDMEERANSSMGIRLMNRLVNQLQSTLNIDKTEEGVRFWFNFK